ncbi:hypothetical protein GN958_ATG16520 [Phytophthora infestans]|uniref:Uncharacterized protein n=1 Tax=Phytophthora infestans TaxID=4787 RepID=A0A8S9U3S0_PHYIN|nr:hypothetical protein GN958_ATG16520 [Phytophthora infestans]
MPLVPISSMEFVFATNEAESTSAAKSSLLSLVSLLAYGIRFATNGAESTSPAMIRVQKKMSAITRSGLTGAVYLATFAPQTSGVASKARPCRSCLCSPMGFVFATNGAESTSAAMFRFRTKLFPVTRSGLTGAV